MINITKISQYPDISGQKKILLHFWKVGLVHYISLHSAGKPIDSQICVGGGDRLFHFSLSSSCCVVPVILSLCLYVRLWLWDQSRNLSQSSPRHTKSTCIERYLRVMCLSWLTSTVIKIIVSNISALQKSSEVQINEVCSKRTWWAHNLPKWLIASLAQN